MTEAGIPLPKQRPWQALSNFAGLPFLAGLMLVCLGAPGRGFELGTFNVWAGAVTPLVIAAIGQTQIVLAGGQGLAAGSTALLVNLLVVAHADASAGSVLTWSVLGMLVGGAIGACNGILVGLLRLPSTAVTLATSLMATGATLSLAEATATATPAQAFIADGFLPKTVLPGAIVVILMVIALVLDASGLGRRIRAAGHGGLPAVDRRSVAWVTLAYVIAGLGYGISGVLFACQSGAADPTTGALSLVEVYAAVVLGGSVPYLRQGSTLGAAIGALFVGGLSYGTALLGWPDYAAGVLIALILLGGLWRAGSGLPKAVTVEPPPVRIVRFPTACWVLPLVLAALVLTGHGTAILHVDPVVPLVAALLALAQASVVTTGHFDMSLPAITALAGAACVTFSQGVDATLVWVVPLLLGAGAFVGFANGASAMLLKGPRVLTTLASRHLLETAAMIIAIAFPPGFAPNSLTAVVDSPWLAPCVILATGLILWAARPARRSLRQLMSGAMPETARRGAPVLHATAGILAAAVGIVLAGYGGKAPIAGGDPFTLPSLLAVETAGFTIGRRGGNPWMLALSIPLVLAIDMLTTIAGVSYPARVGIMGALLLASVIAQGVGGRLWTALRIGRHRPAR